jgi:very-short-patch-repair endonuclease
MSSMRLTLDQLSAAMRKQVEQKMAGRPRKKGSAPLIPKLSEPEERLAFHLRADGLGHFKRELVFWPARKFRFDFAFIVERIAIEVDGGLHSGGRHTRAKGFEKDCMKLNEAAILGWMVLRFSPSQISSGHAVHTIKRALEARRNEGGKGAGNAKEKQGLRGGQDRARCELAEAAP